MNELDKTINDCLRKAREYDELAISCRETQDNYVRILGTAYKPDYSTSKECTMSASKHRQLAEWLKELKKYKIAHYKLRDMDYEYDLNSKFGDNPMYYGHKVWDLFGDIDASVEYEVMGYEEVNADEDSD